MPHLLSSIMGAFDCMSFSEIKIAKSVFDCTCVWKSYLDPKALFQKVIFINFLGRIFCENNITTQEFEKITSYANNLLQWYFIVVSYLNLIF